MQQPRWRVEEDLQQRKRGILELHSLVCAPPRALSHSIMPLSTHTHTHKKEINKLQREMGSMAQSGQYLS